MKEARAPGSALPNVAAAGLLLLAIGALFTTPLRAVSLFAPERGAAAAAAGALFVIVVAGLVWLGRHRAQRALGAAVAFLGRLPAPRLLGAGVAFGIALRIAWIAAVPAPFTSDGRTYVFAAEQLLRTGIYSSESGARADWPPGYAFFLAPHMLMLGDSRLAVHVANVEMFAALAVLGWWLARRVFGTGAAALIVLCLAIWPNLVALSAVPSKELFLAVLVTGAVCLQVAAIDAPGWRRGLLLLATGLALGASALVQPGTALLLGPFVVHLLWATPATRARLAGVGALVAGTLLVVAPWVWRNEQVTGVALLSTSGGTVLYGANHEGATGAYSPELAHPLHAHDEVQENRRGFALARAWVAQHPGDFASLMLRKQVFFLGDDGDGVFHTLRHRGWSTRSYAAAKGFTAAFWLLLWTAVLLGVVTRGRSFAARSEPLLVILTLLYFAAVDSVFEAGGRHHVPLAAGIALLALGALQPVVAVEDRR